MKKQTIYEHLEDLRKTFIKILILFSSFFVFSFVFLSEIFIFFSSKILETEYAFLNPLEPIIGKIELSLWLSLILPFPLYTLFIYQFLEPALYKKERKFAKKLFFSTFFFPFIFLFSFYLSLKFFSFLKTFAFGKIIWSFYFTIKTILWFSFFLTLIFFFPIVLRIGISTKIIKKDYLKSNRKIVYVVAFIIAAIITPTTDPLTQTIFAILIILLFEISIL